MIMRLFFRSQFANRAKLFRWKAARQTPSNPIAPFIRHVHALDASFPSLKAQWIPAPACRLQWRGRVGLGMAESGRFPHPASLFNPKDGITRKNFELRLKYITFLSLNVFLTNSGLKTAE